MSITSADLIVVYKGKRYYGQFIDKECLLYSMQTGFFIKVVPAAKVQVKGG